MLYTLGVDFGTLSGRAVIVNAQNGQELSSCSMNYPHAVMSESLPCGKSLPPDYALQHPQDYLDVLGTTVKCVIEKSKINVDNIIGVGIDFTASSPLPVYKDGTPLCFDEKYASNPHAYVKLWKHHAAQKYANKLNSIANQRHEPWLDKYGGKISSEWLFPKLWQVLEEAPDVYNDMDFFIEAADWVIWQLTGTQTRNLCTAGYKAIWNKKDGYPCTEFFKNLNPKLENVVKEKLDCPISPLGTKAGEISEFAANLTGLKAGTAVAVANVDAHVTVPATGIDQEGDLLAIMGTSTCHMLVGKTEKIVPGMCGVCEDGILPGLFGYEAGQSCVGDHFAWFVDNYVNADYAKQAKEAGKSVMSFMISKAKELKAGQSGILALDWWNGNRSVLADVDLTGMFIGMTLATKPEELLYALIEATAFGTRMIIDTFNSYGIEVKRFFAAGGIAEKDPFTMQIYSDVLNMPIRTAGSAQAPALGSAIFGAVAAGAANGGYDTINEASAVMSSLSEKEYRPNAENVKIYDKLYAEYKILHDYFGKGENDVMKRLKDIKK